MQTIRRMNAVRLTAILFSMAGSLDAAVVFMDDFHAGTEPDPAKWTQREDSGCSVYLQGDALQAAFIGASAPRFATATSVTLPLPAGWTNVVLTGKWAFPVQGYGECLVQLQNPDNMDVLVQASYVNWVGSSPLKAWRGTHTGSGNDYVNLSSLPTTLTPFTLTVTEGGWSFETEGVSRSYTTTHMAGLTEIQLVIGGWEYSALNNCAIFDDILLSAEAPAPIGSGTDPAHKYAWGENVGWANAAPTNHEVTVHYYEGTGGWLSGYAWGENIGWIVMGSAGGGPYLNTTSNNWGVNLAADGDLSGYAWGENIGWINFGDAQCDAAVDPANGEFSGHAWGENIGWLKFKGTSPDYGVRSMAFYTQPQGTPNWWLAHFGVTEAHDAGDGVPAWQKYVMDVDPGVSSNSLYITAISNAPARTDVSFAPASTRRYYSLTRREDLTVGGWSNVVGQAGILGVGGTQTLQDTNTAARAFFRVQVTVEP